MKRRVVSIGQLRPSVRVDDELEWFFNLAEGAMGNQSNYLGMLGRHGPGSEIPSPEAAVEAAHRHRLILDRLRAIPLGDAGVLLCAYKLRDWPVALWDVLGRLTGVVVRLACALDVVAVDEDTLSILEMARADWLTSLCPHAAIDTTLLRLRREAQARFAQAHDAYRAVRALSLKGAS